MGCRVMSIAILTPAERLAAINAPKLEPVNSFAVCPDDWIIVCAGFEDRATSILANVIAGGAPVNIVLISYKPEVTENKLDEIRQMCRLNSANVVELTYNRQDPAGFGDKLLETIAPCSDRVLVDISAMSRLLIVQIIVAMSQRSNGFEKCEIAYTEAAFYPPNRAEAEEQLAKSQTDPTFCILFLSSGVFDITLVPELSSTAMLGAPSRLIAFPSLDAHHLIALRSELQPSRCSFIEGVPPSTENQWRQEVISAINRLDQIKEKELLTASTLQYSETLKCLLDVYSQHGMRERLLVAPTGSKMQAVAVGIFRSVVREVHIVYPTPDGFRSPEKYTCGVGAFHRLSLEGFRMSEFLGHAAF